MKNEYLKINGNMAYYDSVAAGEEMTKRSEAETWFNEVVILGVETLFVGTANGAVYRIDKSDLKSVTPEAFAAEFHLPEPVDTAAPSEALYTAGQYNVAVTAFVNGVLHGVVGDKIEITEDAAVAHVVEIKGKEDVREKLRANRDALAKELSAVEAEIEKTDKEVTDLRDRYRVTVAAYCQAARGAGKEPPEVLVNFIK